MFKQRLALAATLALAALPVAACGDDDDDGGGEVGEAVEAAPARRS